MRLTDGELEAYRSTGQLHYARNATRFVTPALRYGASVVVPIT